MKTILLTNDDGFHAPGIKYLYDALSPRYNVVVAAPLKEQSGVGHTFTFMRPLTCRTAGAGDQMPGYIIDGSPADCVKFAISTLLPQRPDIVVSGINNGDNSGIASFYSGTVAAAREGAFYGIPSFAFSMFDRDNPHTEQYAEMTPFLIEEILEAAGNAIDKRVFYNINFPPCSPDESRGFKVTWQSLANYEDSYKKISGDSNSVDGIYHVYGDRPKIEPSNSFDARAVLNNYIAITPLSYDPTAQHIMPYLHKHLEENGGD